MNTKTDRNGKVTTYVYDIISGIDAGCSEEKDTDAKGNVTTYTYDGAGNRKAATTVKGGSTIIVTYSYNDQNRLMNTVTTVNAAITEKVTYTYDNNGNQLTSSTVAYVNGNQFA